MAKEYLHTQPDPNIALPPLLLRPPGLDQPPKEHEGHGKETRKWWQREAEIWFGRYNQPFNVKSQLARHKATYVVFVKALIEGIRIIQSGVKMRIDGA